MKTVYRLYKIPSDEALKASADDESLSISDKYPLYAFTDDKKIRDDFFLVRDKKRFIEIKSKMENEDYVSFANQNNSELLKRYNYDYLKCYTSDKRKYKLSETEIITTWNEMNFVEACIENGVTDICEQINYEFTPFMLKSKYVDALHKLEFINFWKLNAPERYIALMSEEDRDSMDYSIPSIQFDEVQIFILLFSDTLKK